MTRLRYAVSALLLEDWERFDGVRGSLEEAEPWIEEIAERVEKFPWMEDEGARQRLLYALYGALLVDEAEDDVVGAATLGRCIEALATAVRETLPETTRPAWIGPRGEVIARWLGSLLPENAAIPLSARLPKQPVIVILADDAELAQLVEMGLSPEASAFPLFQVVKDPGEIGSPMADVIGFFRADLRLPLELLDAEKTADRLTPRMLAGRLQDEARAARREVSEVAEARPEPAKGQGTLFEVLEEEEVQDTDEVPPALEAVEPVPEPEVVLEPVEFFLEVSRERREVLSWVRPVSLEERLTLDPASL